MKRGKLEHIKSRWQFPEYIRNYEIKTMVEVGVLYGAYSEWLLSRCPNLTLYLVDPWVNQPRDQYIDGVQDIDLAKAFDECHKKLAKFGNRAKFYRMFSSEFAKQMTEEGQTFDCVYLDGVHHDPQFSEDLRLFYPLVNVDGIFSGHDYYDTEVRHPDGSLAYLCQVKSIVDQWGEKTGYQIHGTHVPNTGEYTIDDSWWIIKDDREIEFESESESKPETDPDKVITAPVSPPEEEKPKQSTGTVFIGEIEGKPKLSRKRKGIG